MQQRELIISCKQLEESRRFYECLGLQFVEGQAEQGGGLIATNFGGRRIRLCAATTTARIPTVLVLRVKDTHQVYVAMMRQGFIRLNHNEYLDPDGNRVRMLEPWNESLPEEGE